MQQAIWTTSFVTYIIQFLALIIMQSQVWPLREEQNLHSALSPKSLPTPALQLYHSNNCTTNQLTQPIDIWTINLKNNPVEGKVLSIMLLPSQLIQAQFSILSSYLFPTINSNINVIQLFISCIPAFISCCTIDIGNRCIGALLPYIRNDILTDTYTSTPFNKLQNRRTEHATC